MTHALESVRHALLHLHKTMIDVAREDLERIEGRLTPNELLRRLMEDPGLAWMRQLSELIVRMDEWLDEPAGDEIADALLAVAASLLAPGEATDAFAVNYVELLQRSPDVVVAHGDVMRSLRLPCTSHRP